MKFVRFYSLIASLLLLSSCATWQPSGLQYTLEQVRKEAVVEDSSIYYLLQPYKTQVDERMNDSLVENLRVMKKEQPESALGNMMADVIFNHAKDAGLNPDLAVTNYGGIRVALLEAGQLSYRDAFQLMPFDNKVVLVEVSGTVLLQLFTHIASKGGWPVSNATMQMNEQRVPISPIYIGGVVLDTAATYQLATTDYLANGGDYCDFLKGLPQKDTGVLLRDAIIEYWKALRERNQSLDVNIEGRISYVR